MKVPLWLSFTLPNTKVSVNAVDPCWSAIPAIGARDSGPIQPKDGVPAVIVAKQVRVSESAPAVWEGLERVIVTEVTEKQQRQKLVCV